MPRSFPFPYLISKSALIGFSLFCNTAISVADTISLKNGDRITGKVTLIEDNIIHVKTDYAGTLKINSRNIVEFNVDAPVSVKESRFTQSIPATKVLYDHTKPGLEDRLVITSHGIPQSIPFNKDLTVAKMNGSNFKARAFKHSGSIDISANFDHDTSKTLRYRFKGNYKLEHDLWRHTFNGNMYRKRDNDKTKSYYYNLNYSADRFFTKDFFWQGSAEYQYDWVEKIRENLLVGIGPGWQVWDNERSSLSFATLLNYQELRYKKETDESHNPQMALKWDYQQYFFNQKFKFSTTGIIGRSFNEDVTLDLNLNTTLAYKLTDSLSFNTSYHYESIKAKRGDSKNRSLSLGLGYQW